MKYKSLYQKAALAIISLVLALVTVETALRIIYPAQLKYYVWPPYLWHHFKPDTTILSGISNSSIFSINSYGVRVGGCNIIKETDIVRPTGDNEGSKGDYLLCLGGSTTECLYLDDNKTWEAQIAWQAKQASDSSLRFIGNIGKSGCTSTENYIHLKYCVSQYKKINTVVLMTGVNDLLKRLSRDTLYRNDYRITRLVEDSLVHTIFELNEHKAWWRRLALFHFVQSTYYRMYKLNQKDSTALYLDDTAEVYFTWRLKRQHASAYIDTLPDMLSALNNFERNLNLIIDEAEKQKLEIIFVNQAAIWKDTMSAEEQRVLWMGGIGNFKNPYNHKYYTTRALRQGISLYNQRLAEVCHKRKVKLIDLDSQLPRALDIFYDDCHFNEAGAKMVGRIIYNGIKSSF